MFSASARAGAGGGGSAAAAPEPSLRWGDLTTVGQMEMAKAAFGDNILSDLKALKIDARKIYEPSTPDTQCGNVIGGVVADTTCWICGLHIKYKDKVNRELLENFVVQFNQIEEQRIYRINEKREGKKLLKFVPVTSETIDLEPGQCEHKLPIIQAIMLLSIYISADHMALVNDAKNKETIAKMLAINKKGGKVSPKDIENAVKLAVTAKVAADNYVKEKVIEYEWAHQHCNMIKNDDVYINQDEEGYFHVNIDSIKELLKNIWERADLDYTYTSIFVPLLYSQYASRDDFIARRTPEMAKELQTICNHLNSFTVLCDHIPGKETERVYAPGLLTLRGAIAARHGPMHGTAAELIEGRAAGSGAAVPIIPRTDLGTPDSRFAALMRKSKSKMSGAIETYINESAGEYRDTALEYYAAAIASSNSKDTAVDAKNKMDVVDNFLILNIIAGARKIVEARGRRNKAEMLKNVGLFEREFTTPVFSKVQDIDIIRGIATKIEEIKRGEVAAGGGSAAAAVAEDIPAKYPSIIKEIANELEEEATKIEVADISVIEEDPIRVTSDEIASIATELKRLAQTGEYNRTTNLTSISAAYVTLKGVPDLSIPATSSTPLYAPRGAASVNGFSKGVKSLSIPAYSSTPLAAPRGGPVNAFSIKSAAPYADSTPLDEFLQLLGKIAAATEPAVVAYKAGGGSRRGRSRGRRKTTLRTKKRITRRKRKNM